MCIIVYIICPGLFKDMHPVRLTRIFVPGYSVLVLSLFRFRLFIREFPVNAFIFLLTALVLLCSDATLADTINTTEVINEISAHATQTRLNNAINIVLRTCCAYQSQFNESNEECAETNDDDNDDQRKSHPEFLKIPEHLVSREYRNLTWSRTFRLQHSPISCPNGTTAVNVSISPPSAALPSGKRPFQGVLITPVNGYLRHNSDVFYPDEYCFNKIDESELQIVICKPDCTESRPCVHKCCDVGQVWDLTKYPEGPARCSFAGDKQWLPQIYSQVRAKAPVDSIRPHIIVIHPRHFCEEDSTIHRLKPFMDEKKRPFRILQTGETWYKFDRRKWAPFFRGTYCVDGSFIKNDLDDRGYFSGNYDDTIVWDCGPPLDTPTTISTSGLYGVSMVIAAFFLLITIIVYTLLWDKQNVHGWTLLCYFTSLFFTYVFYSAVHFSSLYLVQEDSFVIPCYIIGVCAHFFFLASFCFMSCVNFDLFWTFRTLMPTGGKSKGLKKFAAYNIFSLGIPTIIVAVGITLDHMYRDDPDSEIIIPEYGKKTCYLDREYAALLYMHAPAGLLLCFNLVFFTITVYRMYKIQQSTKIATMNSSKNAKQRQSMLLFAKLSLIMGLPWISEVISSTTQKGVIIPIYFKILDMINIFQAVAIFILFVLKVDIRNSLETKYPRFQRFMVAITIPPERADSILRRHPRLRFIINPLTRSATSTKSFSTAKTTLSNGTEASTSSRANVLGRRNSDLSDDISISSSASNSPSGSLAGKRSERTKKQTPTEILEMKFQVQT